MSMHDQWAVTNIGQIQGICEIVPNNIKPVIILRHHIIYAGLLSFSKNLKSSYTLQLRAVAGIWYNMRAERPEKKPWNPFVAWIEDIASEIPKKNSVVRDA